MSKLIKTDNEYKEWIGELKQRIRQSQIKAAVKVNTELLKLYWSCLLYTSDAADE